MLPAHRRYIYAEQGLGCAVVTALINAGIAWLLLGGRTGLPLWGSVSTAGDVLSTAFLLPLLVCLIITLQTRRAVASGRFPALEIPDSLLSWMPWIPASARQRSVRLAVAGLVLVGLPTTLLLVVLHPEPMEASMFIVFKAVFAGLFAGLLGPLVARIALADSRSHG